MSGRIRTSVDITLIEGHMGKGKTTTAVAKVVDDWKKDNTLKIFANMHLYGVPYYYNPDIKTTAELLKNPEFTHAKWIIDESYIAGDSRRGMSGSTIVLTWVLQQMRKRDIEVIYIVQHTRMLDWRLVWAANKRIECVDFDWDEDKQRGTRMIKCIIKDLDKKTEKTIRFWAPQYWPYYDTNEIPEIPQAVIQKMVGASA